METLGLLCQRGMGWPVEESSWTTGTKGEAAVPPTPLAQLSSAQHSTATERRRSRGLHAGMAPSLASAEEAGTVFPFPSSLSFLLLTS